MRMTNDECRMTNDGGMRIVVSDRDGLVCDAKIDVGSRKVESLILDDGLQEKVMVGLAVLSGCVEAVLRAEFEKSNPDTLKREQRTTSTTRPDVPVCEGGCE